MTANNALAIAILGLVALTGYLILTNKTTDEERDEMLDEESWWT